MNKTRTTTVTAQSTTIKTIKTIIIEKTTMMTKRITVLKK